MKDILRKDFDGKRKIRKFSLSLKKGVFQNPGNPGNLGGLRKSVEIKLDSWSPIIFGIFDSCSRILHTGVIIALFSFKKLITVNKLLKQIVSVLFFSQIVSTLFFPHRSIVNLEKPVSPETAEQSYHRNLLWWISMTQHAFKAVNSCE